MSGNRPGRDIDYAQDIRTIKRPAHNPGDATRVRTLIIGHEADIIMRDPILVDLVSKLPSRKAIESGAHVMGIPGRWRVESQIIGREIRNGAKRRKRYRRCGQSQDIR
jgi:hypothetical protein